MAKVQIVPGFRCRGGASIYAVDFSGQRVWDTFMQELDRGWEFYAPDVGFRGMMSRRLVFEYGPRFGHVEVDNDR